VSAPSASRLAVLLTLGAVCGACGDDSAPAQNDPHTCGSPPEPVAPGELVGGEDPAALFAPYWGNFNGTLTWTDGGVTPFILSLATGSDSHFYAPKCDDPQSVYTYPNLGLTTEDGGLDETEVATLDVPLPNVTVDPTFMLGPSIIPSSAWRGAISPHLPSNSASYTNWTLEPVVAWTPGAPLPTSLLLYFRATPSGTTEADQIRIASVTFP